MLGIEADGMRVGGGDGVQIGEFELTARRVLLGLVFSLGFLPIVPRTNFRSADDKKGCLVALAIFT